MIPPTDEIIDVHRCSSQEDNEFLMECTKSEEFNKFIGTNLNFLGKDCYILTQNDKYIGFFSMDIDKSLGISICKPDIYISNRIYSLHALFKVVSYIFNNSDTHKITILVYSNNGRFISVLKKLSIHCEGILECNHLFENEPLDVHLFSILKSEIKNLSFLVNKRFSKVLARISKDDTV